MKIINARTGQLQSIPFSLGESGRGRWLEEVKLSNRPGQTPSGSEDVGYFVFGTDHKHVILTKANPNQFGVLIRIDTQGCYTRNTSGSVKLIAGSAKLLVSGSYAWGDAGGIGGGSDELWHVESPSVFGVVLSGGSYKGYGHRYVIVTPSFQVVMIKRDDLCQAIATDEEPELAQVARQFKDVLHKDIQAAIELADRLEENDEPATPALHFFNGSSLEEAIGEYGLAIPVNLRLPDGGIGGVSGVKSGTLVPGDKPLVMYSVSPMGGRRYGVNYEEAGVTHLGTLEDWRGTTREVLAVVDTPDWHIDLRHFKDGEPYVNTRVDAGGTHYAHPATGEVYQTIPWVGREPVAPARDTMGGVVTPAVEPDTEVGGGAMAEAIKKAGLI